MRTLFLCSSCHSETLIHRSLFLLFSSRRRVFSSSSSLSSSSSSSSSSSWRHHHDEESRNVKVSVWWDFENCSVPVGVNVFRVGQRIVGALRANGIKGPVAITAFGDVSQLSRSTQEALSYTGICLTHVPHSGKNSADRSLLLDLVCWVSQNPPPAHLFLISGDRDFANILHRLRMSNYNILLASTDCTSGVLCSAASIMWQWNGLVRGDSLTGKHFNHPPDGVYGSWYGHYKRPLDDPLSDAEQSPLLQSEASPEPGIDAKPRPIPKALVNRIRQILNSYPDGVSLSELRTELGKSNITMDKDFFGYKKFSRFLLSMPNVLKLEHHPSGNGQSLVYGINGKTTEAMTSNSKKTSTGLDITDGHTDHRPSSDGLGMFTNSSHQSPKDDELLDSNSKSSSDGPMGHNLTEKLNRISPPSRQGISDVCSPEPVGIEENKVGASTPSQQHDSTGDVGFFRRIWKTWFHDKIGSHIEESCSVPDKISSISFHQDQDANFISCTGSEKRQHKEETGQLVNHHLNLCSTSRFMNESKSDLRERTIRCSENDDDKFNLNAGFFKQFVCWLKVWKAREKHPNHDSVFANKSIKTDDPGKLTEGVNQICRQKNHDLFSKPYFWNDMESFFRTPKGAALVSRSMTREQMAKELQNKGPLIVKALKVDHFPQLVDMLISEKKWVEECASKTFPFKLTLSAKGTYSSTPHARGSNELSAMFSNMTSQSNVRQLPEQQDKKQDESQILNETPINVNASNNQPQNVEELKALFKKICKWTGGIEAEDFKRYFEREFKRDLDYGFYGFSCLENLFIKLSADNGNSDKSSQKPSRCKSKPEADCKNLVVEILQKHPEGFNIRSFKHLFYKRYGYELDYRKLGFPTLASLFQKIMPGLNIKATSILSSRKVKVDIGEEQMCEEISTHLSEKKLGKKSHSNDEAAASRKRDNNRDLTIDQDSLWEELGPVTEAGQLRSGGELAHDELGSAPETGVCVHGLRSGCDGEGDQEMGDQMVLEKPLLSDEDLSDSEGENVTTGVKRAGNNRSEEDSSLLKILNSWYSGKDGVGKDDMQNIDEIVDCARTRSNDSSKPSDSSAVFAEKMHHDTSSRAKLRPHKNYSFVSDSTRDDEEKLIDGILGSLRKSADTRMES